MSGRAGEPAGPGVAQYHARPLEGEAMRRRIGARLFGAASEPLCIGRYRVLHTLGQGGMGIVYAAEDPQLDRVVAVKLIRPDVDPRRQDERQRLLREARALARLSHPNVIHIYEVGEHGDEIFIAMEHVPGTTLLRWLDAPRTFSEILAHFVAAGRGLAAAHAAGVVHRDFKPGNVLVGADGRVRIVDFGLARAPAGPSVTEARAPGPADQTPTSDRPALDTEPAAGTPGYIPPERLLARGSDPRSDQFSFCVALHEALYGRRPFADGLFTALVRRERPRLAASGRCGRVPGWLRGALLRGLAFEPDARFVDMDALLAVLEGGPRRRVQRFGATGALALGLGLAAPQVMPDAPACPDAAAALEHTWGPARRDALREAFLASGLRDAAGAWTRAETEIVNYIGGWIEVSRDACEASRVRGEQTDAVLYRSRLCLEGRRQALATLLDLLLAGDPAVIAGAHELAAALPRVAACRDPALLAADSDLGASDQRVALVEQQLRRARFLQQAGRGQAALRGISAALAESRALGERRLEAEALLLRGTIEARELHDRVGASQTLLQAYGHAVAGGHPAIVASIWNELALSSAQDGEQAEPARVWLKLAWSGFEVRPDPLLRAELLDTESYVALLEQRFEHVEALRREALALREATLPAGHPAIVRSRMLIANALAEQGRFAEARTLLTALLGEERERFGPDDPGLLAIERSAALVAIDLDDRAAARGLLLHVRAIAAELYGESSAQAASADLDLARIATHEGDRPEAIARAQAALRVFTAIYPPAHSERLAALLELAELYRQTRQRASALAINRELLAVHDRHGLEFETDGLLLNIGNYLCLLQRCPESLVPFTRLMSELALRPDDPPHRGALPMHGIGRAHLANGQPAAALPYLEAADDLLRRSPGAELHIAAQNDRLLARCLRLLKVQPARARQLEAHAAELERALGEVPWE